MNKTILCFFAGLALMLMTGLCPAQPRYQPYLTATELPDAVKFLPAPPEMGSAAFVYDVAQYKWGKTQREGERGVRAREEGTTDIAVMAKMFSAAFGKELSDEGTPLTLKLLRRSIITIRRSATHPKATYMRVRPYVYYEEPTIIPEDEAKERHTGSYPSGHTVRGWGMALVLMQLNPARQDEILLAGYEWGQSRVIAGFHWQSDVDASRLLASACFARLQSCPEYLQDLAAAKEELGLN